MRLFSILALGASFMSPVVVAAAGPSCAPSNFGLQYEKIVFLYKVFCTDLSNQGFQSYEHFLSPPWISFNFTKGDDSASCDISSCQSNYETLINNCGIRDNTFFGGGVIDAACGLYNVTLWNPDETPAPVGNGKATTTINSLPATTSGSLPSSSSSLPPTSSTTSEVATSSFSETSSTQSESTSSTQVSAALSTAQSFPNSTAANPTSEIRNGSSIISSTTAGPTGTESQIFFASSTNTAGASATRPAVGTASLGSGAEVLHTSVRSLLGVACLFAFL